MTIKYPAGSPIPWAFQLGSRSYCPPDSGVYCPACLGLGGFIQGANMQPPMIKVNLRDVVNRLALQAMAKQPTTTYVHAEPIADEYVSKITMWTKCLTPAQLGRYFSMEEVMALAGLKGRYRDHASVRYTGEALRRCGFIQKRDWTASGRNKRYWLFEGE